VAPLTVVIEPIDLIVRKLIVPNPALHESMPMVPPPALPPVVVLQAVLVRPAVPVLVLLVQMLADQNHVERLLGTMRLCSVVPIARSMIVSAT
jgi:hypothetical protein